MIINIKSIFNKIKKSSTVNELDNSDILITTVKFKLNYKDLNIGFLEFSIDDDSWTFKYSEEFKNQVTIAPIISFPEKNKIYKGKELWSFFTSRIPDNIEGASASELKSKTENKTLIDLLKSYGQKTITNPFELSIG
jgi:HipA-like protein